MPHARLPTGACCCGLARASTLTLALAAALVRLRRMQLSQTCKKCVAPVLSFIAHSFSDDVSQCIQTMLQQAHMQMCSLQLSDMHSGIAQFLSASML